MQKTNDDDIPMWKLGIPVAVTVVLLVSLIFMLIS